MRKNNEFASFTPLIIKCTNKTVKGLLWQVTEGASRQFRCQLSALLKLISFPTREKVSNHALLQPSILYANLFHCQFICCTNLFQEMYSVLYQLIVCWWHCHSLPLLMLKSKSFLNCKFQWYRYPFLSLEMQSRRRSIIVAAYSF